MLLISAFVTVLMATIATKKYRNNINAKPTGMAHLYEILMDFINKEIVYPNIGEKYAKTWTPVQLKILVVQLTYHYFYLKVLQLLLWLFAYSQL